MDYKVSVIISKETEDDEIEYEVLVHVWIAPAEKDVGINSAYIDDKEIISINEVGSKEILHPDNWPFKEEEIFEQIDDVELVESAREIEYDRFEYCNNDERI